jgi:acetate kinase
LLAQAFASIPGPVDVIGHRIVHGGTFHESARLTVEVRAAIQKQAELAPAHNPLGLAIIEAADRAFGSAVPQIAVFDTAFHSTMAPVAYTYPGPYEWLDEGIRRYGFHGINHGYVARRAPQMLGRDPASLRLITCHLGNGASLAAVKGGKSVDTTMGFTPVEGLMMGSRSGSVDPGILIYLMRHRGMGADQLEDTLNHKSGLLGISGSSGDMREILAALERGDQRAKLAYDLYAHRLVRESGAMLAVLGGVDAFVFTGGIGENCPPLRDAAARQFEFLGLWLDSAKNSASDLDQHKLDRDIAAADSRVRVLVIKAQEEWEIALQCQQLLQR